jgi:hypothetical protein
MIYIFITNIPVTLGTSNKWPRHHGDTPTPSKLSLLSDTAQLELRC